MQLEGLGKLKKIQSHWDLNLRSSSLYHSASTIYATAYPHTINVLTKMGRMDFCNVILEIKKKYIYIYIYIYIALILSIICSDLHDALILKQNQPHETPVQYQF
jgi:hypothetical protein